MSYCRWSSDDFSCDLYCYKSDEGYVTHVASNRVVGPVPRIDVSLLDRGDIDGFAAQHAAQHKYTKTCTRAAINGPYDNQTFFDETLEEFRARLLVLRAAGYRFPEGLIGEVEAEMREVHD